MSILFVVIVECRQSKIEKPEVVRDDTRRAHCLIKIHPLLLFFFCGPALFNGNQLFPRAHRATDSMRRF